MTVSEIPPHQGIPEWLHMADNQHSCLGFTDAVVMCHGNFGTDWKSRRGTKAAPSYPST